MICRRPEQVLSAPGLDFPTLADIRTGLAGAPSFVPSGGPAGRVDAADRPGRTRRAPSRPLVSIRNRSVG